MPATCARSPTPAIPCDALSGLAFSQAISSFKSLAAMVCRAVISKGPCASSTTGLTSSTRSYSIRQGARQRPLPDVEIDGGEVSRRRPPEMMRGTWTFGYDPSVGLGAGKLDHLRPLLRLARDKVGKLSSRSRGHCAAHLDKPR